MGTDTSINGNEYSYLHELRAAFVNICMSTKLAATLLFSTLALAADREKIFSLAYTENSKQMNEIATVIRSSTEDRTLMVDEGRKTLTTKGTEQQIAITDWLLKQLDVPASAIPAGGEYKAGDDDFVQVRRFPLSMGVRPIQEIVTAIRSAVELRRMFIYGSPNPAAVVIRGTRAELAMAQWLFRNVLD